MVIKGHLTRMDKTNLRQVLADNVRRYRARVGISQDNFAIECGVHRTYVGQVERCERNVTLATLELFARAMHTDVPSLLTRDCVV
jgi:transcriptional regulator with XRE-family HTH domain